MSFQFWRRWLMVVSLGVIAYSLAMIFLPDTMQQLFNGLFFGFSQTVFSQEALAYNRLVQGVLGAVMIGWMTTFLALLLLFQQPDRRVWMILTVAMSVWFVMDTGFSLWIGAVAHALFNVPFVVLFAIPLVALYPKLKS